MNRRPLISICTVTYNHESFIEKTIEGFLMQKTTFPFEIIIGEDCSTDRTFQIIEKYRKENPELIKIITSEKNVGHIENYIRVYTAAKGKYIAICDGDDFWINPDKLQKQVNFLETNPDYAICFHNSIIVNESNTKKGLYCNHKKNVFSINDLFLSNIMPTSSVVCRNNINDIFIQRIRKVDADDWVLHLHNAEYGKIYYMKENWAAYRDHSGGIWAGLSQVEKIKYKIKSVFDMNSAFNYKYEEQFIENIYKIYSTKPFGYKDFFKHLKTKIKNIFK